MKLYGIQRTAGAMLVCMAVSLCAGGCQKAVIGEAEEANAENETSVIDWYINFSWYTTTWGENLVSKAITEKTGISIDYIAPKGTESEKLDAMIASDTLPDLVTIGWWEPQCQELIDSGKVYALNELAEEYAPDFLDHTNAEAVKWYTQSDGNIYGYPNSSYSPEAVRETDHIASNQNFLVRKDIYEAIGSPDMSTQEGFMEAVRKAAKEFPEVDGQSMIPIGADEFDAEGSNSFSGYLQNFLAVPFEKDGAYYDRQTDPEYLSWLKVFRQLGEEGYLEDAIFIDKRSQIEEKLADGRYFCLFYQNLDLANSQKILKRDHPERMYIAVKGPANSDGEDPVLPIQGISGWTLTFVSKNCKAPDKAIQLMDYLISEEGQKMTYLGVEGEMYEMKDGVPKAKEEVLTMLNTDRIAYDRTYGADNTYWMFQNNIMQQQWEYNVDDPIRQLRQWTYPYAAYTGQFDLCFTDIEMQRIFTRIQKLWGEALPELLLAENEDVFDEVLDEYIEKREKAGFAEFCKAASEEYQKNTEKLRISK